jgi:hypothetical protein
MLSSQSRRFREVSLSIYHDYRVEKRGVNPGEHLPALMAGRQVRGGIPAARVSENLRAENFLTFFGVCAYGYLRGNELGAVSNSRTGQAK